MLLCQNACTIGINNASHLPRLDSPRTKFPCLRISTQSQLEGTKVQRIYIKLPNHSLRNDYDQRYTENTLTALYTTDQQHVLICSTYLPPDNCRRKGRRCTNQISLYFGDNQSVLANTTAPHSQLKKKSNSVAYHHCREGVAFDE